MKCCTKPGCVGKHKARGLCDKHYWAYRLTLPSVKAYRKAYSKGYRRKTPTYTAKQRDVIRKRNREAQRRYRARHWERVREIEKRYRSTERGRETLRVGVMKYAKSAKGRATQKRTYRKQYSDPVKRAAILERCRRWAKANPEKVRESHNRWLRENPNGQRYQRRNLLGLPANAPDSLCITAELLRALKQEMKSGLERTK